jgi:hypothetical protein
MRVGVFVFLRHMQSQVVEVYAALHNNEPIYPQCQQQTLAFGLVLSNAAFLAESVQLDHGPYPCLIIPL